MHYYLLTVTALGRHMFAIISTVVLDAERDLLAIANFLLL